MNGLMHELEKEFVKVDIQTTEEANKIIMDELERELSTVLGLEEIKVQLRTYAKGFIMDSHRKQLGIHVAARKPPHMVLMGNSGTGKTMMGKIIGKYLHKFEVLSSNKVIEVEVMDIVGKTPSETGQNIMKKVEEAEGGILFINNVDLLVPPKEDEHSKGIKLMLNSIMESGKLSIIFSTTTEKMKNLLGYSEYLFTRTESSHFIFKNYSYDELAKILELELTKQEGRFHGFQLPPSCNLHPSGNIKVIAELIQKRTLNGECYHMNGHLVNQILAKAIENLDGRLQVGCKDKSRLLTITLRDLEVSLYMFNRRHQLHFEGTTTIIPNPKSMNSHVYFDITINQRITGRIVMELYADLTPKTAENFRALCTGEKGIGKSGKPLHYKGSIFHIAYAGAYCAGGDITANNGTGGESIYGSFFTEVKHEKKLTGPGMVCMANHGGTMGSQFIICTEKVKVLDGKHVVFGHVVQGMDVVKSIEKCESYCNKGKINSTVCVAYCGQLS